MSASTASLNFGDVTVGSSSTLAVTLTPRGTGSITLDSATVAGTGFTLVTTPFPVTLRYGRTDTLNVTFTPSATGVASGTLTINTNSSTTPTVVVNLSATGVAARTAAALTVSSNTLGFGSVTDGSSSTLPVTLTSTGTGAVTVSSATISGTGFTVSGATFPLTLNPQQTATLDVKFAPTTTGSASGILTINSTSTSNPTATVSLSGTGVATQNQVDLSWYAPTNSTDPVAGYNVYRATGTSSNFQLLNKVVDSETSYQDTTVQAGTSYSYYVESVDASGVTSTPSNTANVSVP